MSQWSITSSRANGKKQSISKPAPKAASRTRHETQTISARHNGKKGTGLTVRCPHKANGCEWVGDSEEMKRKQRESEEPR